MRNWRIHLQVPIHWQDMVHWGKNNKRKEFPRPEVTKVRNALKRTHMPYCEIVAFINPLHNGGRMQWLDFTVWIRSKRRMGVILFEAKWGKAHSASLYTQRAFAIKQQFLIEHDTPVLILPRYYATDEYELLLRRWEMSMRGR
jgi:hypothetical protein